MHPVHLSLSQFREDYPEFACLGDNVITACWKQAELYCCNTCHAIIPSHHRAELLYMLVAHIATLRFGVNGHGPTGLVGTISNAKEGSVSVSTNFGKIKSNQQWFVQTQYGAMFWEATKQYRCGFYVPPPCSSEFFIPEY